MLLRSLRRVVSRAPRFVPGLESLEERALLDAVRWINPAGGDWATPANWSTGQLPGNNDVAIIDIPGITVTHSTGNDAIGDLVASNGAFMLAGGTLDVSRTLQGSSMFLINGGQLAHATVASSFSINATYQGGSLDDVIFAAGARLELNSDFAEPYLDIYNGLTMNGTADLGVQGRWQGELRFQGTQALLGTGRLNFGFALGAISQSQSDATLTFGSGLSLQGQGFISSQGTLINEATIVVGARQGLNIDAGVTFINRGSLNTVGGGFQTDGGAFINEGMIQIENQGGLQLYNRSWTNHGTIDLRDSGAVLGGTFHPSDLGDFHRSGGSVLVNGILDARGETLALNAKTGSWQIQGSSAVLLGGTVSLSDGAQLNPSNCTFDGVTIDGDLELGYRGEGFHARNGLTVNGTLYMGDRQNSAAGSILFDGVQTLTVTNGVVFSNVRNNALIVNGFLTIAAGTVVHGQNGSIIDLFSGDVLVNYGSIAADSAQGTIIVSVTTFINAGPLSASSGGNLRVSGNWDTFAPIQFSGSGSLTLDGTWAYGLPLLISGGTVNFFGNWQLGDQLSVQAGTVNIGNHGHTWRLNRLQMTGGTVNLDGDFNRNSIGAFANSAGEVNILGSYDNTNNFLLLDATTGSWNLAGGTIRGGTVQTSGGGQLVGMGGRLDGVTLNGDLVIPNVNTRVYVSNGLVLNGTVFLGGGLYFSGTQSLTTTSSGTVLFNDSFNSSFGYDFQSGTITLTIGLGITLRGGSCGISVGDGSLINHGTIEASNPGGRVSLYSATWWNDGTLGAANGDTLELAGSSLNLMQGVLSGGIWEVSNGGTLRFDGADVRTNDAMIRLDGSTSRFVRDGSGTNVLAALGLNSADGRLELLGGYPMTLGDFTNAGIVVLGPGSILSLHGDFTQATGALLQIVLGDHPDTGQFGQLVIDGTAVLDGALRVTVADPFRPVVGDTFAVMLWSQQNGDFAFIDLPNLGPDLHLQTQESDTALTLLTVPDPVVPVNPAALREYANSRPSMMLP